ncbi:porin family protein [Horticoccus sp. 23ND18S-11]|uniref:hypothetical protein n=1 Tax=Horticoccus sp. 23ND18S-11 TaxID=3391832 RepID=UPI0039C985D1
MKTTRIKLIAALVLLAPAPLLAIPAWSRSEATACSTCHATPTWQLTNVGLDFIRNGHRADPSKFNAKIQTWDNYFSLIWKGRFFNDRLDDAKTGNANTQRPSTNFEQHSFSLYTGGALYNRFSYFTELYLSENTGSTSGANVVQGDASRKKLAEAFIQYNHPLPDSQFVAVRAGEILPSILHTFGVGARSAEQRAVVLNEALAGNSNTYRPFSRQQGIDVQYNAKHFEVAAGLLNGSDTSTTNSIDADSHKDWFVSGLYTVDEQASGVGVIHYNGQFSNYTTKQDFSTALLYRNDFYRTGLLGRFIRDKWRLVGTYFMGEETVNATKAKAKNKGYYGLMDYNFTDSFGVFARYDFLDPNTSLGRNESKMILVGLNGLLYSSMKSGARWQIEYSVKDTYLGGTLTTAGTTKYSDQRLFAQVTWGF